MNITKEILRQAVEKIKTDPRWAKKWCDRHGDTFFRFNNGFAGFTGLGYKFPFSRTPRGKEIDERYDEGLFLAVFVNGTGTNIRLGIKVSEPDQINYDSTSEAIKTLTKIK